MKRHVRAFISVATTLGKESEVADALSKLDEVKEVHIIPGRYDILAVVEVSRHLLEPDSQSIYWFMLDKLKGIPSIVDTETIIPILSTSKWST
jgi:DNA-binding Lrp family transcriptional regulator